MRSHTVVRASREDSRFFGGNQKPQREGKKARDAFFRFIQRTCILVLLMEHAAIGAKLYRSGSLSKRLQLVPSPICLDENEVQSRRVLAFHTASQGDLMFLTSV